MIKLILKLIFIGRQIKAAAFPLLRRLKLKILGETLYGAITAAPILQCKEIEKSILDFSRVTKRYFLVSFPYGVKFGGGQRRLFKVISTVNLQAAY
jgi:hypothetical protein